MNDDDYDCVNLSFLGM